MTATRRLSVTIRAAPPLATLVIVAGLLVSLGCGGQPGSEAPVPPDPDLAGMEPQVADLLRGARQSVVADQSSAEAWGVLGAAYDAHGLMIVAELCYRRAHELAPEDFKWAYLLAVVREIQGADHAEVVELFGRAARIRPDYAPIYVRLGDALSLRGEHEAARDAFHRALRLEPQTLAVFRLTMKSNFVGCSIGNSPGSAPFKISSTYHAARRFILGISAP